jgi:glycerol-3-phosphate dehydrogenase
MKRDAAHLTDGAFDLLVVGGGIYGAWTAYTGALAGLKTALIERGDWASGTSSASSKLIHGGLRYLEQMRFGLVRTSLDERKRLARLGPHRVAPLRFGLPVYSGDRVGRWRLKVGLTLYDAVAGNGQPVDRHRYAGRAAALARYPFLAEQGLEGVFTYGDCVTDDARFTLEIVDGAVAAGVVAANYVAAVRLLVQNGRAVGVAAADAVGKTEVEIRARVVVNAAGPWVPRTMAGAAAPDRLRLVKGVHLVMPPLPTADALLLFSRRDRRVFFVIPWYGRTLLGTTDTDYVGDPSEAVVERADVEYLLTQANRVLPGARWDEGSILGGFAGVRALQDEPGRPAESLSREWTLDSPMPGLLVSTGGKFTSARADAATIVRRALRELGGERGWRCPTDDRPLPWCPRGEPWEDWLERMTREGARSGLDTETAAAIARRHGTRCGEVYAVAGQDGLARRIVAGLPFARAEIVHAATAEGVVNLEDILRRRVPLLVLDRCDGGVLTDAAALAGEALGWDSDRRQVEARSVLAGRRGA